MFDYIPVTKADINRASSNIILTDGVICVLLPTHKIISTQRYPQVMFSENYHLHLGYINKYGQEAKLPTYLYIQFINATFFLT